VLAWVVWLWLAGASAFWVRLMGGWWIAARMRSERVRQAPPEWQRTLDRLGARIGLSRPARLLVSALVQVPTVVGWLRPVVLVPVAALAALAPEHVEALLAHELAHIRRHDYLVNILQSIAEALLFYHPAVWWVSGHIRTEREMCCDGVAVSVTGDALTYAHALAELESNRSACFDAALAANGGSLADRIGRLLGQPRSVPRAWASPGVTASAILLVMTAYALFGQSAARPRFAAESIKLNKGDWFGSEAIRPLSGGGLIAEHIPLRFFIQNAYDLKPFQILGGPGWLASDRYDIEAKAAGRPGRDQRLMMQSLLEDRFQMKTHREISQLPVYVLTAAKSGLQLPPPKESCFVFEPFRPPPLPLIPGQPPCGATGFVKTGSGWQLRGASITVADLSRFLSAILGRTVIDETGFTRTFDLHVQFAADASVEGLMSRGLDRLSSSEEPPLPPVAGSPDATILIAITEQLGLKLEPAIGPVEILVIDHMERPTEN
jgi:uncharacterized protein (TIGR03435 family)